MGAEIHSVQGKAVRLLLQGLFCLFTVAMLSGPTLYAQTMAATIQGTVTDATGAVVPGASITATNLETGLQRSTTSSGAGLYSMPNLPPGRYRVQMSAPGFQSSVRENVELVVGQQLVLNTSLQIGEITQQVTVTEEAPLVDTTTAQIAGLVAERQVKDLPLNGRSFDNLITLNPAAVNTKAITQGVSSSTGSGNYFSIGGRRPGENIFLWNGVEYPGGTTAESSTPGGISGQMLGIDAVREFNVVPIIDSAEFGHRAGGTIGIVTQSGTNALHGSVFEFLRNNVLDARNFFDAGPIPPFKRNQFGGAAGGPIIKDKTFIFGNYEGFRQRLGLSSVAIVPNLQARQGLLPNAQGVYQPVEGFNPAVVPYFALWPAPNGPEITDPRTGLPTGTALAFNNPSNTIQEDFGIARADHTFSDRDTFNVSYTKDDGASVTPGQNPLSVLNLIQRVQVLNLTHIHVFSPTVLNTFTAGYSRAWWRFQYGVSTTPPGVQSFVAGKPPGQLNIGGGQGNTAIIAAGSGPNTGHDQALIDNIFSYSEALNITKGIHSITTGAWLERLQDNQLNGNFGVMRFPDLASFLQGKATNLDVNPAGLIHPARVWLGAWFVQDAMKLRPNFTLSLGLRHEFTNGWHYNLNRAANFRQGPGGVLEDEVVVGDSLFTKNRATKLFGPRAALAWDPFGKGKTSIRAGYGVAYNLMDNIGWCCRSTLPQAASFQADTPPFPLPVQIKGIPLPAELNARQGGGAGGIQVDPYTPIVFNYRFEVEQAVGSDMTLRVAYLGSRGYHEMQRANANTPFPTILADGSKCFNFLTTVRNPDGTSRSVPNPNCPNGPVTRRNPKFGSQAMFFSSSVNNFNAVYIDLNRRFRSGMAFRANYTFSKSLDNASGLTGTQIAGVAASVVMDPEDRMRDYGLSSFDTRNRFSFNSSYELPFGSGKAFLGGATGLGNTLVSGWQLNVILALQDGFPFTPGLGFSQSRNTDTNNPDRPDIAPGRTVSGAYLRKPEAWIDPTVFQLQTLGTYGNAGRNILIGPGFAGVDMSLFKTTRLTERWGLRFQAEFFNLLNRTNFGLPGLIMLTPSGAIAPSAGRITRTATTSRQIQFGMKLTF
jgi:hypothetical protein